MDEELRGLLRSLPREEIYGLWGRAKERDYDGFAGR
jgi:hypothetical protein